MVDHDDTSPKLLVVSRPELNGSNPHPRAASGRNDHFVGDQTADDFRYKDFPSTNAQYQPQVERPSSDIPSEHPGSHVSSCRSAEGQLERARKRFVTVEFPLLMAALSMSIATMLRPQYVRERIGRDKYNYTAHHNGSSCDVNTTEIDDEIQAETSMYLLYLSLANALPGLIMAIFTGSLSDRIGRKPAIFLGSLGYFVTACSYIVVIYFDLPIMCFMAGDFLSGVIGGVLLLLATSAAYVTDVTTVEKRTYRIVIVETVFFVGYGIGQISLGFALQYTTDPTFKYILPMIVALGCATSAMVYVLVPGFLIETVQKKKAESVTSHISGVLSGMYSLVKENVGGRRIKLLCYTIIIFCTMLAVMGQSTLFIVYSLGQPFCLTALEISIFNVIALVATSLGLIIGGALLPKCLTDHWILQISLLNVMLVNILIGVATNKLMLGISSGIAVLRSLSFPVVRSRMSKLSGKHERGLMLALIGCVENLAQLLAPIILNPVYSATVSFNQSIVFYIIAGILVVPCCITVLLQITDFKTNRYTRLNDRNAEHIYS